jgi:toxin CcdB
MAQFDVHELRAEPRLVVNVQSDLVGNTLDSSLVIPLFDPADARWPFARLTPQLQFGGETWLLATPLMVGLPKAELKSPSGSLAGYRYEIMNAIDFLLTGI